MMALVCSKCGAEFDAPARFCRRCGNSLGVGEPSISPSEATTKSFNYPGEGNPGQPNSTAPANQWPTAPAYLGPDQMAVGPQYPTYPAGATQGLPQKRSNTPVVILGILGLLLLAVIAGFALIISRVGRVQRPADAMGAGPGVQEAPRAPGQASSGHPEIPPPPVPPPGPPGSTNGTVTGPLAPLIYPGSHQEINVEGEDGAKVIKLTTSEPADKVADWYAARIPHSNRVSVPFIGITTISKDGLAVIIKPGNPTTIMLTKGD